MRKGVLGLALAILAAQFAGAENTTLYSGKASTSTQYIGITMGNDALDFLQLQFDVLKYLKDDPALHSEDPKLGRGDFLGVSLNLVLKLPIHLIPSLDSFDYVQPYIVVGRGYAAESLSVDYYDTPTAGTGKTGFFNKLRSFSSFGCGLVVMITPSFGLKFDYRTMKLAELSGLGADGAARKINRLSVGLCFGAYKKEVKKPKKTGERP
jgi:hypothetical protein